MAIGFTVPAITDKKVIPDKSLSKQSTPRVRIQTFGDGYEQRVVDGINNINESFSLSFTNRDKTEADDIIAFFDSKGAATAFEFIHPDTNSTTTTTRTVSGSTSSTTNVTLSATNLEIAAGAVVSYTTDPPISGTPTVASINGTALVLSTAQSISSGTTLTFVNQNERKINVVCDSWTTSFNNKDFYNIQANFRRVYEP